MIQCFPLFLLDKQMIILPDTGWFCSLSVGGVRRARQLPPRLYRAHLPRWRTTRRCYSQKLSLNERKCGM